MNRPRTSKAIVVGCACGVVAILPGAGGGLAFGQVTLLGVNAIPSAISSDGRAVVGTLHTPLARAFVWTSEGGRNDFGNDAGMPWQTSGDAVSADGTYVAGGSVTSASVSGPYRWHGPGTTQFIGNLPAPFEGGTPSGISADGSVLVGWRRNDLIGVTASFYWRQGVGLQQIPIGGARATGLSRDGGVVCGGTGSRAFTWTPSGGARVLNSADGFSPSSATAINFDGTIVIGSSGPTTAATVWRNEVPMTLPYLPGFGFEPTCLNDDASVVAGLGGSIGGTDAIIWTPSRGTELFTTYMAAMGVSVPTGFIASTITGVSSDGRIFVGSGGFLGQPGQGFVVTIPAPGGAGLVAGAVLLSARRRRPSERASLESFHA